MNRKDVFLGALFVAIYNLAWVGLIAAISGTSGLGAFFSWPTGSVWSNLLASAMVAAGVLWKLTKNHREALALAHHHHAELKAHVSGLLTPPSTLGVNTAVINGQRFTQTLESPPVDDAVLARINFTPEAKKPEPIPWPTGLAPVTLNPETTPTAQLPPADVLVVTYTTAEGQALADVLTPGVESAAWTKYTNGWSELKKLIVGHDAPSLYSECSAIYWMCTIGDKRVIVMKSDLHPATDGPNLPIVTAWKQWISQCKPSLVITTGTAGGVGPGSQLGDVIVGRAVKWNCQKQFADKPWAHAEYVPSTLALTYVDQTALGLMQVNIGKIPAEYLKRGPHIWTTADIETTDFFAFDSADDHYGLRAYDDLCGAVEMDDAALGLALESINNPPQWAAVRNASDPGMLTGVNLEAEDKLAAKIYQDCGYWTTVGSAITCWALIAGMQ